MPLPEQLKSPRTKGVVSGVGLWAGVCIVLVSLLFLSNSLKGQNVTKPFVLRGFDGFGPNSTWHFPLYIPRPSSSDTGNGSTGASDGGGSNSTTSVVYTSGSSRSSSSRVSGVILGKKGVIFGGTQFGNSSSGGSEEGLGPGDGGTQLGNSSSGGIEEGLGPGGGGAQLGNTSSGGTEVGFGSVNVSVTVVKSGGNFSGGGEGGRVVGSLEGCDIFDGRWVRDGGGSRPFYLAGSCPYIDRDFNCHLNGRPDDGFLKWRWQPNKCDIPSLNGTDFLERLRGKKLVFVGDSLNRNMWESLVCILRQSIRNKKRVYEISGRREFKKKGIYAFRFEDYNCTVDFVASPFLVRESEFKSGNGTTETLRLDLMDQTTSMYHDADIIVFNTGHWWTHEKTSRGEDYYQEGDHVYPRLKVLEAYKRALVTWAKWVDDNINHSRTLVFFRGYSVTHFRGGQWNSGGQCHSETEPIYNTSYLAKYPSKMRAFEHVLQEMKTPVVYMNISRLTDYRKDGHPSIYRMAYKTEEERTAAVRSQDCSHWCLPGVPDVWNELLYASILKATNGSLRA